MDAVDLDILFAVTDFFEWFLLTLIFKTDYLQVKYVITPHSKLLTFSLFPPFPFPLP